MKPCTATRTRTIMGTTYSIPQPFTAEQFSWADEIGAEPAGLASQANQVLAENLGNNIAARIKKAQKEGTAIPTQEDMDAAYAAYDFSGSRTSYGSLFQRLFVKTASNFVRKLLKSSGYRAEGLKAPVTVAKKDEEPKGNQISFETFEAEVTRLVNGEGPWGEVEAFVNARNQMIEAAQAEEEEITSRARATEEKLGSLGPAL